MNQTEQAQLEMEMRVNTLLKVCPALLAAPLALMIATSAEAALCKQGFVWRDAKDGDGVCVTPAERAEAKMQNRKCKE
jgi:hypothetical protein